MVDVRGDVLRPPHGTTPAAVKSNIKSEMRSFKSNENIHKKEGGSYYVVSANKASSVTAWPLGHELCQYEHNVSSTYASRSQTLTTIFAWSILILQFLCPSEGPSFM